MGKSTESFAASLLVSFSSGVIQYVTNLNSFRLLYISMIVLKFTELLRRYCNAFIGLTVFCVTIVVVKGLLGMNPYDSNKYDSATVFSFILIGFYRTGVIWTWITHAALFFGLLIDTGNELQKLARAIQILFYYWLLHALYWLCSPL